MPPQPIHDILSSLTRELIAAISRSRSGERADDFQRRCLLHALERVFEIGRLYQLSRPL